MTTIAQDPERSQMPISLSAIIKKSFSAFANPLIIASFGL